MAPGAAQYKDLLNPIKDIEKSFSVNIQDLLQNFVYELTHSGTLPNFNSAALLLQGSASVYGKKVEYLYDLAKQLHNNLLKQKKDEQVKKETKEREKKEDKLSDPFLSVDFKIGKNLSVLRKKNLPPANNKPVKKSKFSAIPVHLLSSDEDKGEVFYDTVGEVVGNKGDFAINKCRLTSSGWLLLPTVNPNLVPDVEEILNYDDEDDDLDLNEPFDINMDDIEDPVDIDSLSMHMQASPDEGFGSHPPSGGGQGSTPGTTATPENNQTESSAQSNSVPPSIDEGIPDTPNDVEMCDSPGTAVGIENIPAENEEQRPNSNPAPQPVRQKERRALKTCQLAVEDDPLAGITISKELLKRKKIQKKNCICLPARLKLAPGEEEIVCPISQYCARTFFAIEDKALARSMLNFDSAGFDKNSKFVARMLKRLAVLKKADKSRMMDPIEDEQEIILEDIETLKEDDQIDEAICPLFDDNDIQFNHDDPLPDSDTPPPVLPLDGENGDLIPEAAADVVDLPSADISHVEHEQHIRDLQAFVQNSDITKRVQEWEKLVKPFLDEVEQRESFDINLYGSRILNAFDDNDRKQTTTFRKFCKNKEKWEIHRYFMALLPLANIGNVAIDSEPKADGTEEIYVTLKSRKMHHKELEEFGHNDGSHS